MRGRGIYTVYYIIMTQSYIIKMASFLRELVSFSGLVRYIYRIHGNRIIKSSDTGHCRQSDSRTSVTLILVIWVQTSE